MTKKLTIRTLGLIVLLCSLTTLSYAQEKKEDNTYKPMILKLDDSGKKYIRFIIWNQIWLTSNNFDNEDSNFKLTPLIRRSRLLAYAQISPRFLVLTHFGLNNLNASGLTATGVQGNGPQLFLHGTWVEYKLLDELYAGGGLHYWKGMNRLANSSTLNFMTMDATRPFIGWHSLGQTDQFARHMGVYLKGALGNFDYRLAFNDPINNGLQAGFGVTALNQGGVVYNTNNLYGDTEAGLIVEGYFRYNFWDKESSKLPYAVGTYLGGKKLFAVGAGFFTQPNGSIQLTDTSRQVDAGLTGQALYDDLDDKATKNSVTHFAVDAFLDMPVGNGAINAYATYMNFNYGENFVYRSGSGALEIGTGGVIYGHVGYLLPGKKLMPYVALQTRTWDADNNLDRTSGNTIDIGLNYFVNGHNAKVTLEYHSVNYSGNEIEGAFPGDISQLRVQGHIFL